MYQLLKSMHKSTLIGLGNIAWKMGCDPISGSSLSHADAFHQNHKVVLAAGYSPDIDEVDQFSNSLSVSGYNNLEEMIVQEKPDIVSICSPHEFHAEQLEVCFNYKVPMIWLEKPVANSVSEIEKLENLRKKMPQPSTVLVNFQRRYTESYQRLKQLLNSNIYGDILSVEVRYSRGLVINGSHMMDMLAYLFPQSEFDLLWVERNAKTDNPDFVIQIEAGLIAHVSGIEADYHNIDIVVTCEKARFSILHGGMTIRVEEVKENSMFAGFYRLNDKKSDELGAPGFGHAFDRALEDLITSYEGGHQPGSNLESAIKGQALVERVMQERSL
jgi:predicted dehydrogenase